MIKHYGFEYPPVGLISTIERLNLPEDFVFYILDPFAGQHLPYEEITNTNKKNLFVIIHTHEGASHHWFDILIPKLNNECDVPLDHIIVHSSCVYNPESTVGHIGSLVDYTSTIVSRYENITEVSIVDTTHHFVCLNRIYRWQRLQLVKMLIDRDLCKFGRVSYTSPISVDDPYYKHFPMIVDSVDVSYDQGHKILPEMSNALVNVITESCYEPMPGSNIFESHPQPGFTEKTYKSIMLGQLPIFVAPYHTVQTYRDFGFDPFDDIIDHSYDLEQDPVKRLELVTNQIEHITKFDNLRQLREKLLPRFQANFQKLKYYSFNWDAEFSKWQQYFSKFVAG
jgi:hypothetical protein